VLNPEVRVYEAHRQKPKFGKQVSLKLLQAFAFTTKRPFKSLLFWTNNISPAPHIFSHFPSRPQSSKRHTPIFLLPKYKYTYIYTHHLRLFGSRNLTTPFQKQKNVPPSNPMTPTTDKLIFHSCTLRGKA
jgi:hypothetical protein